MLLIRYDRILVVIQLWGKSFAYKSVEEAHISPRPTDLTELASLEHCNLTRCTLLFYRLMSRPVQRLLRSWRCTRSSLTEVHTRPQSTPVRVRVQFVPLSYSLLAACVLLVFDVQA